MAMTLTRLRQALAGLSESELHVLVEELHGLNADNRRYLTARLDGDTGALLDAYVRALEQAFNPKKRTFRVAEVSKALREYLRFASPLEALEARMRFVRASLEYWKVLPDWPEEQYGYLEDMFREVTVGALAFPDRPDLLAGVEEIGEEFVRQEDAFGYFDGHVRVFSEFRRQLNR
ncbi:hypothetical protein [Deinococcus sp. 23YEL01]|uniref:hypothetical protein n=1 Tax=Deinococcus sp. 23YEL01 TaxID=2745871 RepID=UPI001E56156B|nr:hypothetical protein [Deinococcus sp. 23YEL01]MCD0168723.1 hypothetical protein [Deinococcus sp. 23YEL01]